MRRVRQNKWLRVGFAFMFLCVAFLVPIIAGEMPAVSDWASLTNLVNGVWATNTTLAKVFPPAADMTFVNDQGTMSVDSSFSLTGLVGSASLGITMYPVQVIESNAASRVRMYFNATGGVFRTETPPANYDSSNWTVSVYGQPGAWLTGTNLDAWYAGRDPGRQRIALSLISTSDVPAYLSALSNSAGSANSGGTNTPVLILFSNETLFVRSEAADNFRTMYLHAPDSVTGFSVYASSAIAAPWPGAWNLVARLPHNNDPLTYSYFSTAEFVSFALGTTLDLDGDGISDADETMLFGTDPQNADTDGDGLSDREEIMQYNSIATAWSSMGDGLSDYWKIKLANANPMVAMNANAVDDDGLTAAQRQMLGIGTNHVVVVDVGPAEASIDIKKLSSRRSLTNEAVQGFQTNAYYQKIAVSSAIKWENSSYDDMTTDTLNGQIDEAFVSWTNCQSLWSVNGTLAEEQRITSYTGTVSTGSGKTWNWHGTSDWSAPGTAWQVPYADYLSVTSCAYGATTNCSSGGGCGSVPLIGFTGGTPTNESDSIARWYFGGPAYAFCECSYAGIWYYATGAVTVALSSTIAMTNIIAEAFEDVRKEQDVRAVEWGNNESPTCPTDPKPESVSAYITNGVEVSVVHGAYRIAVTSTTAGIVYRATVAHIFTPEDSTNISMLGTYTYMTNSNGGPITLTPTNGVIVSPPTSNGSISVEIMGIQSETRATIPEGQTRRTTIGVGEVVDLTLAPENNSAFQNLSWSVSGGGTVLVPKNDEPWKAVFTAAVNSATCLVTVNFNGGSCSKVFRVLEPQTIVSAMVDVDDAPNPITGLPFTNGMAGVAMHLNPVVGPTNVSFYNVSVWEGAAPATDDVGYFLNNAPAHDYAHGAYRTNTLTMDNYWPGGDTSGFGPISQPWDNGGGYKWVIPGCWTVKGSGIANSYGSWTSTKFLYDSGTAEDSKFGWLDKRMTNGVVTLTNCEFRVTPGY